MVLDGSVVQGRSPLALPMGPRRSAPSILAPFCKLARDAWFSALRGEDRTGGGRRDEPEGRRSETYGTL